MVALSLPITTAPGEYPQESGGRIINGFMEPLAGNAGTKFALKRSLGLSQFAVTGQQGYRGGLQVGPSFYSAWAEKAVRHTSAGVETVLTGSLLGTLPVFWARNNAGVPDLVAVAPGDGAFKITTSAVSAYPDVDVGAPNCVCYLKGVFVFGYEDSTMRNSDVDTTNINTLNFAVASSKPGALLRVVPSPDGQLLAAKTDCFEVWGGVNDTGFFFSYIRTIEPGIFGRYCITGYEDGWAYGIIFVGADGCVYKLNGYQVQKISDPDLERLILSVTNRDLLQMSVFVSQGRPFVLLQCPQWSWKYDISQASANIWSENQSYFQPTWRGLLPQAAFGEWLFGDRISKRILKLDPMSRQEVDQPLIFEIETGPQGSFPNGARINRLDLYCSVGVGSAPGIDPIETDPSILIYVSKDNGLTWSNPWTRKLGQQARGLQKVTVNNMGHCSPQGVKFKFRVSDPVHVAIMGGDIEATLLGK